MTCVQLSSMRAIGKSSSDVFNKDFVANMSNSCSSGHYIAYTKTPDGTWWRINDDKSSIVSVEEVVNSQAYMMFFSRHDANTDCTNVKHTKPASPP